MGSRYVRPDQPFYHRENSSGYDRYRIGGQFTNRAPGPVGLVLKLWISLAKSVDEALTSLWYFGGLNPLAAIVSDDDRYQRSHVPRSRVRRLQEGYHGGRSHP